MSTDIQFINLTNRYFNQGCLNKTDKLFSVLNSTYPFKKNSKVLFDSWHQKQNSNSTEKESNYSIPGYDGRNEKINALNAFLKKHLSEDLHSAFIHGSHASGDEIPYSDFDGLLILKNEVFSNKKRINKPQGRSVNPIH